MANIGFSDAEIRAMLAEADGKRPGEVGVDACFVIEMIRVIYLMNEASFCSGEVDHRDTPD